MKIKEYFIFIPLLVAFFVLGMLNPSLGLAIPKFLLFQLLFLLLPGYMFSKWLLADDLSKIQRFILGFPVSMVIIFILSWLGKLLNIKYLECIMVAFSIIAIYKIIGERDKKYSVGGGFVLVSTLIYCVCIAITARMFILPSLPPTPQHPGLFYQDSLLHIGIVWGYTRGLPLEHARFSGVLFGYHILKNIHQAIVFNYTRINPFNIHFFIAPIFDWFMMVFIIFYGGLKIAKFSLRKISLFCLGLFFTSSFLGFGFQSDLFINPLSFYFGLPVFILFVFFIISYLNKQRQLSVIYLTALYLYFTATKAILGIIVPIVLLVLFLLKKFFLGEGHSFRKEMLLISSLGLGAILLRFTMFENTIHSLYYDYDISKSLAYQLFSQTHFLRDYIHIIYPVYRFFSSFLRSLPSYLLNWPVLLFLILLVFNSNFKKRVRDAKMPFIFIIIYFLVSISIRCLFGSTGGDVYYAWYTQAIFLLLGIFALDYIFTLDKIFYKLLAILSLVAASISYVYDLNIWHRVGWGKLPSESRVWDERASISYNEWLAMEWLQNNSGADAVFFSDRRHFAHEATRIDLPRFYGYSALSGRQAFAEGETAEITGRFKDTAIERWNLINKFLYSADSAEQEAILKEIPADYFIQSLRFNKGNFLRINNLKLVYKNKDINVFRILK